MKVHRHGSHISGDDEGKLDTGSGFRSSPEPDMSERAAAVSGPQEEEEEEEDSALYYDEEEDDLEAFSEAEPGCEHGGRRTGAGGRAHCY